MKLFIFIIFLVKIKGEIENDPYSNETLHERYENYGVDWMFFPDGNGNPNVAILKEGPNFRTLDVDDDSNSIEYWLYTRDNFNDPYVMKYNDDDNFRESPYDIKKPTKFIIHGWRSSGTADICKTLKNRLLEVEDLNVVVLHWEEIAGNIFYPTAAKKTKDVGENCGEMLNYLIKKGTNPEKVHIIGHSLGAHISGICANSSGDKIGRVSGMDPAGPGFEKLTVAELHLDKSQASFVDVIHTCAGILGYQTAIGTVDIYPNGGTPSQPGCGGFPELIESCSHGRSWKYFAESMRPDVKFKAVKCQSWQDFKNGSCTNEEVIYFGYSINTTAKGTYYTRTGSLPPFSLHDIFD